MGEPWWKSPAASEQRLVEIAERDEIARSLFGGLIRITRWCDKGRLRYSLIVGNRVETIGAWSEREAVTDARAARTLRATREQGGVE